VVVRAAYQTSVAAVQREEQLQVGTAHPAAQAAGTAATVTVSAQVAQVQARTHHAGVTQPQQAAEAQVRPTAAQPPGHQAVAVVVGTPVVLVEPAALDKRAARRLVSLAKALRLAAVVPDLVVVVAATSLAAAATAVEVAASTAVARVAAELVGHSLLHPLRDTPPRLSHRERMVAMAAAQLLRVMASSRSRNSSTGDPVQHQSFRSSASLPRARAMTHSRKGWTGAGL